jgi:hypothetical protein
MTPGNENSGKKLVWEPPQLMRLTAPGEALGGQVCKSGSSDSSGCDSGNAAAGSGCISGTAPAGACDTGSALK